ncbi:MULTISPECIES: serine/arginine repetitive matrix protein 2 [unclassified Streptomyces]|uniref:serine/arginine repetitive matrix protein 2 n=1 Tax=unclassified Streptomyces TaxID=2593676 RepID=UPI003677BE8C
MTARWNDETQRWENPGDAPGRSTEPAWNPAPLPVLPPPPPPGPGPVAGPVPPPDTPEGPPGSPVFDPVSGRWEHAAAPAWTASRLLGRVPRRAVAVAGAVAAVLVAGVVGSRLFLGGDGAEPVAGEPPASVSAPVTAEPEPSTDPPLEPSSAPAPTTAPTGTAPPAGYRTVDDTVGFTIAVPEGWDRTESDQGVFYNAPDGRSLLQVFVIREPGLTPYEALSGVSADGRANKPGYEEIGLRGVGGEPDAPADAAELVYAYDREDGTRRKVVDRAFTAPDGTHYAVLAAGPDTDWPRQREHLRVALEFFRPGTS